VSKAARYANFFVSYLGMSCYKLRRGRRRRMKKIKLTLMSLNNLCFLIFKMESSHKISFSASCVNFFYYAAFMFVAIILYFLLLTANFFFGTLFQEIILFYVCLYFIKKIEIFWIRIINLVLWTFHEFSIYSKIQIFKCLFTVFF
jgi:hypothetical protein